MRTVFETELSGFPIKLEQQGSGYGDFSVTYGEQEWHGLPYRDAARKLGEAMMHGMACEGRLDPR